MEEKLGNVEGAGGPDLGDGVEVARVGVEDALDAQLDARRRRLVSELRNGERLQTVGRLRRAPGGNDPGGFCCLGVACEVAIADGLVLQRRYPKDEGGSFLYETPGELGSTTSLPESVQKWYGFDSQDPWLEVPQVLLDVTDGKLANDWMVGGKFRATALNDDYGLSLAQIGVCFQYTFLREDYEAERG